MDPDLESVSVKPNSLDVRQPQPEIEFLRLYSGGTYDSLDKRNEGIEFLRHMSSLIGDVAIDLFRRTLQPRYRASYADSQRDLGALCYDNNPP
jgi:hypothetical protein